MPINPAFVRHPRHAKLVGQIISSFGEIEFLIIECAGKSIDRRLQILRALYRVKTSSARIEAADGIMREKFVAAGLVGDYAEMIGAVSFCQSIRNRYGHCHFADDPDKKRHGLFYADLQETADRAEGWDYDFKHISVGILEKQLAYFEYAQDWVRYLDHELAAKAEKIKANPFPKPTRQPQPIPHSRASRHVPPWLDVNAKARHIARARAAEEHARQRAPKPKVPKLSAKQRREAAMKRRGRSGGKK